MRTRFIVLLLIGATLAVPASASAHAKSATVALDYRLEIDRATRSLAPVSVPILDGDRALRVADEGRNRRRARQPPRADAPHRPGRSMGESRVDHRRRRGAHEARTRLGACVRRTELHVARPPARAAAVGAKTGPAGALRDPGDRRRTACDDRRHVRAGRATGGLAVARGVRRVRGCRLRSRRARRRRVTTALGAVAGLAALAALTTFSAADAPNGRVAWLQLVLGIGLAVVVCIALLRAGSRGASQRPACSVRSRRRVSLGSLPMRSGTASSSRRSLRRAPGAAARSRSSQRCGGAQLPAERRRAEGERRDRASRLASHRRSTRGRSAPGPRYRRRRSYRGARRQARRAHALCQRADVPRAHRALRASQGGHRPAGHRRGTERLQSTRCGRRRRPASSRSRAAARYTLGDLFPSGAARLRRTQLLSFRSGAGAVLTSAASAVAGDPRRIAADAGARRSCSRSAATSPPHPSYLFPKGRG